MHESIAVFPSWKHGKSNTPLNIAAIDGDIEMIKFYLDKHHDPKDCNEKGETALISAISNGHTEIAKLLLNACMDTADQSDYFKRTPLIHAADNNNTTIIAELLKLGTVDVNQKTLFNKRTPLGIACVKGNVEAVKLLLKDNHIQHIFFLEGVFLFLHYLIHRLKLMVSLPHNSHN